MHILHNSEQPASVFGLLESGNKMVSLIADPMFDLIIIKVKNTQLYQNKTQTKIESKGPRFELGDFFIKLGVVTMNQNFKGVLIEVKCVFKNYSTLRGEKKCLPNRMAVDLASGEIKREQRTIGQKFGRSCGFSLPLGEISHCSVSEFGRIKRFF